MIKIPLSFPDITEKEINAVTSVLRTPYLSIGPKVKEFEDKFARFIGTKYAIAVANGTCGLHLCIKSLNIGKGDEVITTPFSFIASANCILFENARPVFVDINPDTLNMDENKIEEKITKKTKAILPVHVFGYPCDMKKINMIARKHNLFIIEDACEAIGASINKKKVGTFGDCAVFAFYPNKQMTTGEGGMVVTNDRKLAGVIESLRNQGRDGRKEWLSHNRLGFNYRLSEMQSALGIVQLGRINELLEKRNKVATLYQKALSNFSQISLPADLRAKDKRSWFVYVVLLNEKYSGNRDRIIRSLRGRGIGCNIYFPPIHLQQFYKEQFGFKPGDFPVTESISERTIALPFFSTMTAKQVGQVKAVLAKVLT